VPVVSAFSHDAKSATEVVGEKRAVRAQEISTISVHRMWMAQNPIEFDRLRSPFSLFALDTPAWPQLTFSAGQDSSYEAAGVASRARVLR
jgi:hypothetical protein